MLLSNTYVVKLHNFKACLSLDSKPLQEAGLLAHDSKFLVKLSVDYQLNFSMHVYGNPRG